MKENSLKQAQQEVEEALSAVESIEKDLKDSSLSRDSVKKSFLLLSEKVEQLESILKEEGIL